MIFTREDILKIQNALLQLGRKDSEFKDANTPLNSNDEIAILQDGINKKVSINNLLSTLGLLKKDDFINVSDRYDEYYILLSEAITIIANNKRKKGLVITFQDLQGNWKIYQFDGELNNFSNTNYWKDLFDFKYPIIDSILPDEEDLTLTYPDNSNNSFIKLKDRDYDALNFSGKATKILRKNIKEINGERKNILTQDAFTKQNCIYEIRYDFDLNSETITIPNNCILKFNGGTLVNGVLIGNATLIKADIVKIFKDIKFENTWGSFNIYPLWWGAKADYTEEFIDNNYIENGTDNTQYIISAVEFSNLTHNKVIIPANKYPYGISKSVAINLSKYDYINIEGLGKDATVLKQMSNGIIGFYVQNVNAIVSLCNLTILGRHKETPTQGTDSDRPIAVTIANTVTIDNVKVIYSRQMSITAKAYDTCVSNCYVEFSARDSINLTGSINTKVINCTIKHGNDDAIAVHRNIYSGTTTSSDGLIEFTTGGTTLNTSTIISNNVIEDVNGIVCLGAVNTIISNNIIKRAKYYAIRAGGWGSSSYPIEGNNNSCLIDVHDNIIIGVINGPLIGESAAMGYAIWIGGFSGNSGWFDKTSKDYITPYGDIFNNNSSSTSLSAENSISGLNLKIHNNIICGKITDKANINYSELGCGFIFKDSGGLQDVAGSSLGSITSAIYILQSADHAIIDGNTSIGTFYFIKYFEGNFKDLIISNNKVVDSWTVFSNNTPTICTMLVHIINNYFNLIPYKSNSLNSNYTWKDVPYGIMIGDNISSESLIYIKNNIIKNAPYVIKIGTKGTVVENNTYYLDVVNGSSTFRGVGFPVSIRTNKVIYQNLDYDDENYNNIKTGVNDYITFSDKIIEGCHLKNLIIVNTNSSNNIKYWIAKNNSDGTLENDWKPVYIIDRQSTLPTNNIKGDLYINTAVNPTPFIFDGDKWAAINNNKLEITKGQFTPGLWYAYDGTDDREEINSGTLRTISRLIVNPNTYYKVNKLTSITVEDITYYPYITIRGQNKTYYWDSICTNDLYFYTESNNDITFHVMYMRYKDSNTRLLQPLLDVIPDFKVVLTIETPNGGTTDKRPLYISVGHQYLDTTLLKPIWWNGTNWIDINGETV